MLRKSILLAVALIVLGSTYAFADWSFPIEATPGDCTISGTFTVHSDGTWNWDGYAWSTDTGDEVDFTVTFLDSNQNYLTQVSSHFDISVDYQWRRWWDFGNYGGYYNQIGYYRVSTSG